MIHIYIYIYIYILLGLSHYALSIFECDLNLIKKEYSFYPLKYSISFFLKNMLFLRRICLFLKIACFFFTDQCQIHKPSLYRELLPSARKDVLNNFDLKISLSSIASNFLVISSTIKKLKTRSLALTQFVNITIGLRTGTRVW